MEYSALKKLENRYQMLDYIVKYQQQISFAQELQNFGHNFVQGFGFVSKLESVDTRLFTPSYICMPTIYYSSAITTLIFMKKIIMSDEVYFHWNGCVNKIIHQPPLHPLQVPVWWAIWAEGLKTF